MNIPFNGFVPATLDAVMERFLVKREYNLLCWWKKDNGTFYYPSLLISAYYGMRYPDFREQFEISKDVLVVGDSGGFQVQAKDEYLEPVSVLRWLESNADVALTLDVPPKVLGPSSIVKDINDFRARAKQTARYYDAMLRNRQNYNLILLKVLHGGSKIEVETFYSITKNHNFDGWALAPKPASEPLALALQFAYLIDKGELDNCKWLHILGISGSHTLPLAYYIKSVLPKGTGFTVDSSIWATGGKFRRLIFPFSFIATLEIQIGKNPTKTSIIINSENYTKFEGKMPCFCPICSNIDLQTMVTDQYNEGKIWSGLFLSLHNLWSTLYYCQFLDFLSSDPNYIKIWISKNCSEKTRKAVEFIEKTINQGFNTAYNQFRDWFRNLEPVVEQQTTLW